MRTIKFRGKTITGEWVYGFAKTIFDDWCIYNCEYSPPVIKVLPETIGQFMGMLDKNGKEIYEGDIVLYYIEKSCRDNDFGGSEPHLSHTTLYVGKETDSIIFKDGCFILSKDDPYDEFGYTPINQCGISDIRSVSKRQDCYFNEDLNEHDNKGIWFDGDGAEITRDMEGVRVIGNIHDNPKLLNNY